MRPLPLFVAGVLSCCGSAILLHAAPAKKEPVKKEPASPKAAPQARPPIDIVFAIDCSGSMGGVIETAKQKIWDIVNQAAQAKPTPQLRIGLLAYGDASRTYRSFDLSSDLDTVYQNLTSFRDEGWSEEYVGEAIGKAIDGMSWSNSTGKVPSLRTLYVVGNETARQGPIDFTLSAPRAREKKIYVNAIYCGTGDGKETWREFSKLGSGQYLEIAADGGSVLIPTPYDRQIEELNLKLNGTYLPYGARGEAASSNQRIQDLNAARAGGAYASTSRALAKAGNQYLNAEWDLVDKSLEPGFDLEKIPVDQLPANMREMSSAERKSFLEKKRKERFDLQKQLLELGTKRSSFLQEANKKSGRKDSLDSALKGSFGGQAAAGGFGGMSGGF